MNPSEESHVASPVSVETRLKVLEKFVSALAHDLRTPLTVIRNATYILRRTAAATPDVAECAAMIEGETQEINQLVTRLVEIVQPCALTLGDASLSELLNAAVEKVDQEKRGKWQFQVEFDPPTMNCDSERIGHVLHQLFKNAVAATRGMGTVTVRAIRDDKLVTIDVTDDGPGISADLRETVFDPFVTTRRSGMGLGLTYCREVLKRHGGDIQLLAGDKTGAAFRLTIPLTPTSDN